MTKVFKINVTLRANTDEEALLVVPLPPNTTDQTLVSVHLPPGAESAVVQDIGSPQRALLTRGLGGQPTTISYRLRERAGATPEDEVAHSVNRFRAFPYDLCEVASQLTRGACCDLKKVEDIVSHTESRFEYVYVNDTDGELPPLSCDILTGNCLTINAYLLALFRCADIPAIYHAGYFFEAGVPFAPDMHCWVSTLVDGVHNSWDIAHHFKRRLGPTRPAKNPVPGRRFSMSMGRNLNFPVVGSLVQISHLSTPWWIGRDGAVEAQPAQIALEVDEDTQQLLASCGADRDASARPTQLQRPNRKEEAMNRDQVTVLDCTLRDGGFYTGWSFDPVTVDRYLRAMKESGVDRVELGFRCPRSRTGQGEYFYTTDELLARLDLPGGIEYGVMSWARDYMNAPGGVQAAVRSHYAPQAESRFKFVRLAIDHHEIAPAANLAHELHALGYDVLLLIMQIGNIPLAELAKTAALVQSWDTISGIYFADSIGSMTPESVGATIDALREGWRGPIGVHTHDNKGFALVNSMAALSRGATWVDATVLGMGRGPGNTRTEQVMAELRQAGVGSYNPEALLPLLAGDFAALRARYGWETNLYYHLSALYNVHATYVQELLAHPDAATFDIPAALRFLSQPGGSYFTKELFDGAIDVATARAAAA